LENEIGGSGELRFGFVPALQGARRALKQGDVKEAKGYLQGARTVSLRECDRLPIGLLAISCITTHTTHTATSDARLHFPQLKINQQPFL
jgi:hypothetical protein